MRDPASASMRDPALPMALMVLPTFVAVSFSALVYTAQAQEYPPGLFERSPLVEPQGSPAKPQGSPVKSQGSPRTGVWHQSQATENPASEASGGSCKHYREWFYPWPQPCQGSPRTDVWHQSHATQNLASEAPEGSCKHYREWFYPWPQPC
jgi:hypothetical protein